MRRTLRRAAIVALGAALGLWAVPSHGEDLSVSMQAGAISHFLIGSDQTDFGALRFAGGLELAADTRHFGAVSAIRFRDAGRRFIAVTDTGFWLTGEVERDASGHPTGWTHVRMREIEGADGLPLTDKYEADAEGLALGDGRVTVGFERYHRLTDYALGEDGMPGKPLRNVDFIVPANELRANRGFECLTASPAEGPLGGARVAISEKSLDKKGNIFGAVLEGNRRGIFTVVKSGVFDITDCAFLPGGDLVLLERRYSIGTGVGMQLRRISGTTISKGAVLDGEVLFSGGMDYQIDNMEGADIWRAGDGTLHLSLISDDNHSLLQRNLYLEFVIAE